MHCSELLGEKTFPFFLWLKLNRNEWCAHGECIRSHKFRRQCVCVCVSTVPRVVSSTVPIMKTENIQYNTEKVVDERVYVREMRGTDRVGAYYLAFV